MNAAWQNIIIGFQLFSDPSADRRKQNLRRPEIFFPVCQHIHRNSLRKKISGAAICHFIDQRRQAQQLCRKQFRHICKCRLVKLFLRDFPELQMFIFYKNACISKRLTFQLIVIDDRKIKKITMRYLRQQRFVHSGMYQFAGNMAFYFFIIGIKTHIIPRRFFHARMVLQNLFSDPVNGSSALILAEKWPKPDCRGYILPLSQNCQTVYTGNVVF